MLRTIRILLICIAFSIILSSCASRPFTAITPPEHPLPPRKIENPHIALALGGGGAKGMAHVGVLEVLKENNIPIDLIVGTSAGSIVGALYADQQDITRLKTIMLNSKKWDVIDPTIFSVYKSTFLLSGLAEGNAIKHFLYKHLKHEQIEDLPIPFVAVAANISKNVAHGFTSGPVVHSVYASSAIPPIFTPIKLYGDFYIDGGVIEPVPVRMAKRYNPKILIAVDITSKPTTDMPRSMLGLTYQSISLFYYELSHMQSSQADIIIQPNIHDFGLLDDHEAEAMYLAGKEAAIKAIPKIKALMQQKQQ